MNWLWIQIHSRGHYHLKYLDCFGHSLSAIFLKKCWMCHLHLNLQDQQAFVFFSRRNPCDSLNASSKFVQFLVLRAQYCFLWLSFLKQVWHLWDLECYSLYGWSRLTASATFDGDGWYGFSMIFLFVDFLFLFQLFEECFGNWGNMLGITFLSSLWHTFPPPHRSMTLENLHYKWNCFHKEWNFSLLTAWIHSFKMSGLLIRNLWNKMPYPFSSLIVQP